MVTLVVSGICILVFVLELVGVVSVGDYAILPELVKQGEIYRLFTGAIMHASYYHIFGNLGAFINVGTFIESKYGRKNYLLILLASLLGSGLAVVSLSSNVYTVGLSGVVWGVFGAYAAYLYKNDSRLDRNEITQLARMLVPNVIISLLPGVSWQGHFGGFVAGLAISLLLPLNRMFYNGLDEKQI